jgi:putative FmdB family regulatory protein
MPLYTYSCDRDGEFSAWGRMAESDAPQPCPTCTKPAPRALARPALGGRSEGADLAGGCGEGGGACAMGGEAQSLGGGGGCCGGGACVH